MRKWKKVYTEQMQNVTNLHSGSIIHLQGPSLPFC